MIFPTNCQTRCVPTGDGILTEPVLLLVAEITPKVPPEEADEAGLARLVWLRALKASAWN